MLNRLSFRSCRYPRRRIGIRWKRIVVNNSLYGSLKVMMLMTLALRKGGENRLVENVTVDSRNDKKTRFAIASEMMTRTHRRQRHIKHRTYDIKILITSYTNKVNIGKQNYTNDYPAAIGGCYR